MTFLDDAFDRDEARRRAGDAGAQAAVVVRASLYWTGWLVAKLVLGVLLSVAGILYGVGWFAGRAVWPAMCWTGRAVKLGYQEGARGGR